MARSVAIRRRGGVGAWLTGAGGGLPFSRVRWASASRRWACGWTQLQARSQRADFSSAGRSLASLKSSTSAARFEAKLESTLGHVAALRRAADGLERAWVRLGPERPRRPVGPGGCEIRRARPTAGTRPRVQPIPRAIAPPDGVRPKSSSPSDSRSCTLPATQSGRGREDERVGSESGEEAPIDTRAGAASRCARFEQAAYALRARVLGAERRRALGLARLGAGAEARPARNRWRGRGHGGKTMFTLSERGRLALRSVGRRRA